MDSYLTRDVSLARSQVRELGLLWRRAKGERQGILDKLQQAQHEHQVCKPCMYTGNGSSSWDLVLATNQHRAKNHTA